MISNLTGTLLFKGDRFAIISAGGVGYRVRCAPQTLRAFPNEGDVVTVWTHLCVREDSLDLYGFLSYGELNFFEVLIGVPGVGPKSATGILGAAPLDALKRAIAAGETTYLTKISGVGKRMAEKIIVELRDKLGGIDMAESVREELAADADVLDALVAMGYSPRDARDAVTRVPQDITGTKKRLAEALKIVGKR